MMAVSGDLCAGFNLQAKLAILRRLYAMQERSSYQATYSVPRSIVWRIRPLALIQA